MYEGEQEVHATFTYLGQIHVLLKLEAHAAFSGKCVLPFPKQQFEYRLSWSQTKPNTQDRGTSQVLISGRQGYNWAMGPNTNLSPR